MVVLGVWFEAIDRFRKPGTREKLRWWASAGALTLALACVAELLVNLHLSAVDAFFPLP